MASPTPVYAKDAIKSRIPDPRIGQYDTSSNTIHDMHFVASLAVWQMFVDAWQYSQGTNWDAHKATLAHQPRGAMPLYSGIEHVFVGDETGVQGRFAQNVGQALTQACRAFGLDLSFGDYKACSDRSVEGVPDSVCLTSAGALRVLGEVKTPWVKSHRFYSVGQIAAYMRQAHIRYAFFTTYNQTVFLRQVDLGGGQWGLEHSPPIAHDGTAGRNVGQITLKEAFWFVLGQASAGHVAANDMAMDQWVV